MIKKLGITALEYDLSGLSVNIGEREIMQSSKIDDHITAICRSTQFYILNMHKIRNLLLYDDMLTF